MFKSKKVVSLVLCVLLVLSGMGVCVFAASPIEEKTTITAFAASDIDSMSAYLDYSGKTLYPAGLGIARSGSASVTITVTLQRKSGSSWIDEQSWTGSGTGAAMASGTYTGTSGSTYRTKVVVKAGSSTETLYSGTKTL